MSDHLPAKITAEQIEYEMQAQLAQQELAPSLTPAQRKVLARDAEADDRKLDHVGLAQLERRVAEQSAIIVGQRSAIEELRAVFEECAQGARHLAGRLDKAERRAEMLRNWTEQIDGRIIAFQARLIEAFPSIGKTTIAEQCAASWPREEGDSE